MIKVLVTGGSGYLGRHVVKRLLYHGKDVEEVRTLARSGDGIVKLLSMCGDVKRLVPLIGDIRNDGVVAMAMDGIDAVIHLAAMKYIDLAEMNPEECVSVNIDGTRNLLNFAVGKRFVAMSTDKAVEAISCYGASKLIMEKLVLSEGGIVVRSGNIIGSTGSVIELWNQQRKAGQKITVRDSDMTRFFTTVEDLAKYIVDIAFTGDTGRVHIASQLVIRIDDLAKAYLELRGGGKIQYTGMIAGERKHEILYGDNEDAISAIGYNRSDEGIPMPVQEIKEWLARVI